MQGEAVIAALVGLFAGGGGMRLLGGLLGPERDALIAEYYRKVIRGLYEENEQLRGRVSSLENRIEQLELAQDAPPAHLS